MAGGPHRKSPGVSPASVVPGYVAPPRNSAGLLLRRPALPGPTLTRRFTRLLPPRTTGSGPEPASACRARAADARDAPAAGTEGEARAGRCRCPGWPRLISSVELRGGAAALAVPAARRGGRQLDEHPL